MVVFFRGVGILDIIAIQTSILEKNHREKRFLSAIEGKGIIHEFQPCQPNLLYNKAVLLITLIVLIALIALIWAVGTRRRPLSVCAYSGSGSSL